MMCRRHVTAKDRPAFQLLQGSQVCSPISKIAARNDTSDNGTDSEAKIATTG
jgi:hypothetical protein